jgi:hypothetical protein
MSAEVALGAILGIAGTLVGSYATHYFEEKQEDRRAKIEEWKTVVDEVYSPLIFDLMWFRKGILTTLEAIDKTIEKLSNQIPEDQIASSITLLAELQNRRRQSQMIEDILRKNSRLIKPTTLWLDLYLFHSYIEEIEDNFFIISAGRFQNSPTQLLAIVKSCVNMGKKLEDAASHLRVEIGKLVVSTTGVPQSFSYKPFFTNDVIAEMEEHHDSILRVLATPS